MSAPRKKRPLVTACSGCEEEIILEDARVRKPGEKVWHFECLPPMPRAKKMKLPKPQKAKSEYTAPNPGPDKPASQTTGAWVQTSATSAEPTPKKKRGRRKKKAA